jgi:hypothetical protein
VDPGSVHRRAVGANSGGAGKRARQTGRRFGTPQASRKRCGSRSGQPAPFQIDFSCPLHSVIGRDLHVCTGPLQRAGEGRGRRKALEVSEIQPRSTRRALQLLRTAFFGCDKLTVRAGTALRESEQIFLNKSRRRVRRSLERLLLHYSANLTASVNI